MAYYEALPASIIHFITRPEEFGIFFAIMGAIGWDWVQTPMLWLKQLPTGLAIGSGKQYAASGAGQPTEDQATFLLQNVK